MLKTYGEDGLALPGSLVGSLSCHQTAVFHCSTHCFAEL